MSIQKLVVAAANQDFCELLAGYVRFRKNLEIVGASDDGREAIRLIQEKKPDALVMELTIENSGALLSYVRQRERRLRTLAFIRAKGHSAIPVSSEWAETPCGSADNQLAGLSSRMEAILEPAPATEDDRTLELRVSRLLRQFGVPAHIKGYQYLRKAIMTAVKAPEVMSAVTKVLYPDIAKCYGTKASRVERAIRKAIEIAWNRGNIEYLQHYFGYTVDPQAGKPTNSEFIATAVDILYLQQDQSELLACV